MQAPRWVVDEFAAVAAVAQPWRVLVQRPAHRRAGLRWLWLLHGSGAGADELRPVLWSAARAMENGAVPPMIIAAPDAPDGHRSRWWVDSAYEPGSSAGSALDEIPPGRRLEHELLVDVLPAVESSVGPPAGPGNRGVGGISMGGAAALRLLLARADLFGSAVLLSPAAYAGEPPTGSSARTSGAFGAGLDLFVPERFRQIMHYPTLLATRPIQPVAAAVVTVVGDGEPAQRSALPTGPAGESGSCDLDLEAARLHAALKRRTDVSSSLRVIGGGHDLTTWERGIVDALALLPR